MVSPNVVVHAMTLILKVIDLPMERFVIRRLSRLLNIVESARKSRQIAHHAIRDYPYIL